MLASLEELRRPQVTSSPLFDRSPKSLSDDALISLAVWAQRELSRRRCAQMALTRREHQVLEGLVDGCSYKEIAEDLAVSLSTVQSHVRALYRKLEVHSATEAVARALREHLVVVELRPGLRDAPRVG